MELEVYWKREFLTLRRMILDTLFSFIGLLILTMKIIFVGAKIFLLGAKSIGRPMIDDPKSEGFVIDDVFVQKGYELK